MNANDRAAVDGIAVALTAAWNIADGTAFGRQFADDADFVNIYATHGVGRDAIATAHQAIFDGVYRGSRNRFTVIKVRELSGDVALAHVAADLQVPQGPMAGDLSALASVVLVRDGSGWKIAAFHNTRVAAPPGASPAKP
ncbi:MAG: hypothetical protein JWO66_2398 [Candidatus Eremiobacteraeota bacterium]|jgi:uncharacterized protein (TIGR02246 family)|nr:hypothetical protein [Candidatus Eremiobacteraeota bacterium]